MRNWLYFIDSDLEYHKLMDFLLNNSDVYGISYIVFDSNIRFFSDKFGEDKLIAVYFYTHFLDPSKELEKYGLSSDRLMNIYDINISGVKKVDIIHVVLESGKRFIFEEDFLNFLDKIKFKFKDETALASYYK